MHVNGPNLIWATAALSTKSLAIEVPFLREMVYKFSLGFFGLLRNNFFVHTRFIVDGDKLSTI